MPGSKLEATDGETIAPRALGQRKADVLARLNGDADAWIASADRAGRPHLVPLSLCWDGRRVIVRVKQNSRTARNAVASGMARVALGGTRDVVVIDAAVDWAAVVDAPDIAAFYAARTGWDPQQNAAQCVFLLLSPVRIQAWRDVGEIYERTLMHAGRWVL